jgi:hypothetical protein
MGTSMGTSADSIRVVGEADLLELARVARSTWQNWIAKGVLEPSPDGLHREAEVVEVVVLALLIPLLDLRAAKAVWRGCRERVLDESLALDLERPDDLDAVLDPHTWELRLARDPSELYTASRADTAFPRGRLVLPLAATVREARRAFWMRAASPRELARDKRRRSGARQRAAAEKEDRH